MGQKFGPAKEPAEQVVREIRRAAPQQFSAEEKIRIVLSGLGGEDSIANCAAAKGSSRTSIIVVEGIFSRPARSTRPATLRERRPWTRSRSYAGRLARISQTGRCIGVLDLRKSCCKNGLSRKQGVPDAD